MSSYHWEARRRQLMLDRRRRNQLLQQKAEEASQKVPEKRLALSTPNLQPPGLLARSHPLLPVLPMQVSWDDDQRKTATSILGCAIFTTMVMPRD